MMRGLCGWFSRSRFEQGEQILQGMLAANQAPVVDADKQFVPQAAMAAFGATGRPTLLREANALLVIVGHPRLLEGQRRNPQLRDIMQVLRQHGRDAVPRIGGDFALAFWDDDRQGGLLAVDRIGVHQLVYATLQGSLAFASTLDLLVGYPGVQRDISRQGVFDYLFYHVCPGPQTIYDKLLRVAPGHCVEYTADGAATTTAYWSMFFNESAARPLPELKQEFVALMQSAVQEAAEGAVAGAFLSGGTDSSTVSGMLARTGHGPAQTFSIGFHAAGYDEMEYARIAAKHFGCAQHEYYVTPQDVVDAVPKIAASYDQPFGNASAIPTYYCARLARENGMTRLLAGDGGDELFGGNERYAKHYLLGLYGHVPRVLKRALVEPLLVSMPGVESVPLLRKLRSYVLQARPPMPQRYASYNLLMHLGNQTVFTPEFLASIDPEHGQKLLAEAHAPFAHASLINQMLGVDLRFTLADGDLPKVTRMCELAGVDVSFPMLDDRVIEFSQRLASDLKLRRTTLRWFFKQALMEFLPSEVIIKQKHGFGLPVGDWLVGHRPLLDLATDSIGVLRRRQIIQPRFVDELISKRLPEHPAYFGTMIWVLMMLGLWLESRKL